MVLPLPAEVDDEGDAADQRHSAAQRRNDRQRQEVVNRPFLQLLLWEENKAISGNHVSCFIIKKKGARLTLVSPLG